MSGPDREDLLDALQALAPNPWAEPCRTCVHLDEEGCNDCGRPNCDLVDRDAPDATGDCTDYEDGR